MIPGNTCLQRNQTPCTSKRKNIRPDQRPRWPSVTLINPAACADLTLVDSLGPDRPSIMATVYHPSAFLCKTVSQLDKMKWSGDVEGLHPRGRVLESGLSGSPPSPQLPEARGSISHSPVKEACTKFLGHFILCKGIMPLSC